MYLLGLSLVLLALKYFEIGPVAAWSWWWVLAPFAGVFYPLSTLPDWMRWVGAALPPSYVFEGIRAIVQGGAFSQSALWSSLLLSLFYLLLAGLFFGHVYQGAVRSGLLARYSAESVA